MWKIYKGCKDLLSRDTGLSNITSEPAAPELPRPSAETPVPANDTADEENIVVSSAGEVSSETPTATDNPETIEIVSASCSNEENDQVVSLEVSDTTVISS